MGRDRVSGVVQVLTSGLLRNCDPLFTLGFMPLSGEFSLSMKRTPRRPTLHDLENYEPASFQYENNRDTEYHLGRLAFFVAAFREGASVEPLEIDKLCENGLIYPQAILLDGHHRLAAAELIGKTRVPATYGGLVSVLEWLTGETDEEPEEL